MNMNLKDISSNDLVTELLTRQDLLDKNDALILPLYQLFSKYGVFPCVDGVAVRLNSGEIEAMAIRRGTGAEKGKLCSVGGRIKRNETIEECLRRHFKMDVGCEIEMLVPWDRPVDALQCAPIVEVGSNTDFGPEYGKHTISLYYPVLLIGEPTFGATAHGGQEATSVEWYTLKNLPSREEFGYNQRPKFVACLEAAERFLA
jgi:ADP-ribose pyrophosphatase YjhB (NUDIX family)